VVSLAAALAIPLTDTYGAPFPQRDVTLFITFAVILITLVGQGLLLPSVMRWLGLLRGAAEERRLEWQAEHAGRTAALSATRRHLDWLVTHRKLSDQVVADLKARHEQRMHQIPTDREDGLERIREANDFKVELITVERDFLHQLLREGRLTDESRRRVERELDLEEEGIACKREGETPL
jgi:CPA1 family monovalent cation:H+ antiporter